MPALPHDLMRIDAEAFHLPTGSPLWISAALRRHPWVVVRRSAASAPGFLAVGVRGSEREQRFAMQLPDQMNLQQVTPESLTKLITPALESHPIAAVAALPQVKDILRDWRWGPAGSVGFFLATGASCLRPASDIDIVIRCESLLPLDKAASLLAQLEALKPAVDVLMELPFGAVVLKEHVASPHAFVIRTASGPQLSKTFA